MDLALEEARAAGARGEVPVGAVIVAGRCCDRARRQPHAGDDRSHGPCRDAGDPCGLQGAGDRAAHGVRSLGHAGALPGLRRSDRGGAALAALLRGLPTRNRAAWPRVRGSSTIPRHIGHRRSTAGSGRRGRSAPQKVLPGSQGVARDLGPPVPGSRSAARLGALPPRCAPPEFSCQDEGRRKGFVNHNGLNSGSRR
jgi:hypothetical protein